MYRVMGAPTPVYRRPDIVQAAVREILAAHLEVKEKEEVEEKEE